jgi:hypothetical protein
MSQAMIVLSGLIALCGVGAVLYGLRQRQRQQASASWPSVQGRVLSAEIKRQVTTSGNKARTREISYRPIVRYEYEVNGVRYESSRVAFGDVRGRTEEDVRQLLNQSMRAGSLRVFYNPQKPADAVLLNTEKSGIVAYMLVGAAMVIAGIVMGVAFALQ